MLGSKLRFFAQFSLTQIDGIACKQLEIKRFLTKENSNKLRSIPKNFSRIPQKMENFLRDESNFNWNIILLYLILLEIY